MKTASCSITSQDWNRTGIFLGLMAVLAVNVFARGAAAQDNEKQLREYMRWVWPQETRGASDARLNEILRSDYSFVDPTTRRPDRVPWSAVVTAVYMQEKLRLSLRDRAVDFGVDQVKELTRDKVIEEILSRKAPKLVLPFQRLSFVLSSLKFVFDSINAAFRAVEDTKIRIQLDRYCSARAELSHEDIVQQRNTDFVIYYASGSGYIEAVLNNSNTRPAEPRSIPARETWELGKLIYSLKKEGEHYEADKNQIGEVLSPLCRHGVIGGFVGQGSDISAPILVIDRSGSITEKPGVMRQVQRKAEEVVRAIRSRVTEAAVINFSGRGESSVDAPFTGDEKTLLRAIVSPTVSSTGTAIYDAIARAVDLAGQRGQRSMVILFTDGINHDGRNLEEIIRLCGQKSIPVLIVGFEGTEGRNENDLRRLAESTGGFYVRDEQTWIADVLDRFHFYSTHKSITRPRGRPD